MKHQGNLFSWAADLVDDVQVTVDAVPLQDLLADYRFPSPIFSMTGAVDNPYDTWCTGRPAGGATRGSTTPRFRMAGGFFWTLSLRVSTRFISPVICMILIRVGNLE